jgi:hypothetical protein
MLCPGCVSRGIPQASAIRAAFPADALTVIGLHTVFEHHAVMGPEALAAFIHEYRLSFPIGVDQPATTGSIPRTMQAYDMQGTPSLIVIDKAGRIRLNHFGRLDDLRVGALLGRLLGEAVEPAMTDTPAVPKEPAVGCGPDACQRE